MRYIGNTPQQQKEMLRAIGVESVEDLLTRIPTKARLARPLNVLAAMAEMDLIRHMRGLAARNAHADDYVCFLGGGAFQPANGNPIRSVRVARLLLALAA